MYRKALCGLAAGAAMFATGALAQQAPNFAAVQIKATDLGHRTWMLEGQGGNMVLVAGDDANILVDTQFAPLHEKIAAAIAQLNDKPVKYVVNTHLHGDHTGGNQQFWLKGATLVATRELAASMTTGTTNALTGAKTAPAPQAASLRACAWAAPSACGSWRPSNWRSSAAAAVATIGLRMCCCSRAFAICSTIRASPSRASSGCIARKASSTSLRRARAARRRRRPRRRPHHRPRPAIAAGGILISKPTMPSPPNE